MPSTTSVPAVEVRDLVMHYGRGDGQVRAVDGLSLQVAPGTVTAILGPNGAGKTTTIETCEGFRRPQSGQVRVLGLDPVGDAEELRPRVGVMLQSGGAWLGVRAGEMLRHMASLYAHPMPVEPLVERLGMTSFARTTYRRLSGGQKQRLSLAMAIVGRPELVFLDEPTAGLDPQSRRATWDLVDELRRHGVTTVLTTHYMDEAQQLSDFVHIIDAGRVIASGTPTELVADGAQNTIRLRTRAGLDTDSLAKELPAGATVAEPEPGHYVLTTGVDPAVLHRLTGWCAAHDVLVDSVLVEHQTLEDRFLELTGRELR
ncbi:ABC transporter ATP-binding protein [Aeromicrobium flavum]|uniref:ABC transporter ATP-binding protein n=1 Tax=Aeromicrobium flavum TaxID=416568 RepID=A0A512HX12_9ACTN|nr:ABC transporter ATP-binding protein [Aeromicrobium flavum]GEO89996.1 ABC transporter ATP-binding protein [Aeromicrobium flavum]